MEKAPGYGWQPLAEIWRSLWPLKFLRSTTGGYALAVFIVLLATWVRVQLNPLLGSGCIFITFYVAVLISAVAGGWKPGLLAMVLNALLANHFFLGSRRTDLLLGNTTNFNQLILYLTLSAIYISVGGTQHLLRRRSQTLIAQLRQEIAVHRQTGTCLAASQERYRSLFDHNLDAVFTLDLAGRCLTANPSSLKLFGYSLPQLQTRNFQELCPQDELSQIVARWQGAPESFAAQLTAKDGRLLDLLITGGPLIVNEATVGVFAIARDITEHKRAVTLQVAFSKLGQKLSSVATAVEAGRLMGDVAGELFGWDAFSLNLYSLADNQADYILNIDTFNGEKTEILPLRSGPVIPPLAQHIMEQGAELILHDPPRAIAAGFTPFGDTARRPASLMFAPIRYQDKTIGVLSIHSHRPAAYQPSDLAALQTLADYCGGALQRLRAETALRLQEEEYRAIFDSLGSGNAQGDPLTFRFLRVNPKMCELTGYSREELVARTFLDLTHPEDRPASRENFQRLVRGEIHEFRGEQRYQHSNGAFQWVDVTVTLLRDATGRPLRIIASAVDITERVQAETALRESENRFVSFMQHLSAAAWMKDAQGRYLYANAICAKVMHKTPEEIWCRTDEELFAPELAQKFIAADRVVFASGENSQSMQTLQQADGIHHSLVSKFAILDEHGAPAMVGGIAFDITQLKAAEKALAFSNERLGLIARVTNAVVGDAPLADQMRNIAENVRAAYKAAVCSIYVLNPAAEMELLGSAGFEDQPLTPCIPARGGVGEEVMARRAPVFIPDMRVHPGRQIPAPGLTQHADLVSYAGAPLMVQDRIIGIVGVCSAKEIRHFTAEDLEHLQVIANHIAVSIVNDSLYQEVSRQKSDLEEQIAERQQAEAKVQWLNADLERRVHERTDQLQAANRELEAFSYSVSHDLRAPLRSISGFAEALQEDYADRLEPEGRANLNRVIQASREMGQLIDALLHLSRLTRMDLQRERVNLSELAEGIVISLRETQPERCVEFTGAPGLTAAGDARLMRIALANLLNNAWKFTGHQAAPRIEFGIESQPEGPAFYVRDNGAGFDMAYAGKLFNAFQRLHYHAEFPGHGIGLATVQRIIHRHGGRTWATGEVDHGATFYFTLPN